MDFEELKKQVEAKLAGKDSKKVMIVLDEHKEEIEALGKEVFSRGIAWLAQGEVEKAKDLFLIKYQTPEELIAGMAASGAIFKREHEILETKAEKINAMIRSIGEGLAKVILPIIITSL